MSVDGTFLELVQDLLRQPRLAEGVAWTVRRFAPGELLTVEGARAYSLFVVRKGRLAVVGKGGGSGGAPDSEVTIVELRDGDVIGQSSLVASCESIATVRAVTDGEVIQINGAMLSVFLDDHPELGYLFYKYLLAAALGNLAKTNRGLVELATVGLTLQGLSEPEI